MGRTNTKKMVQGAMIAAIFGVFSLFNTYSAGMIDILLCYVMVVPIAWYGYMYSLKDSMIVSVVSLIVIAIVGLPLFVISSISSCIAGVFIGESLRRKAKKSTLLLGTLVATFMNNIMLYEVFSGILGMDLMSEMTQMYETVAPMVGEYVSVNAFLSFIPIVLLLMSVMEMYVIVLLCQLILTRLKVEFPGQFHIAMMHLKPKTGIVISLLLVGSYLLNNVIGFNNIYVTYVYTLSLMTFIIQGLAFLSFICIMKRKLLLQLFVMLGLFIPGINLLYGVIGVIDIFHSDLRRKILYNSSSD